MKQGFISYTLAVLAGTTPSLLANPQGMTTVAGTASSQTSGSQLTVTVGQNTFLNWNSFNIQPGEVTKFVQPGVHSIVLNNISDANPSQIWGSLQANGSVILANAHGFYFGPNSSILVGGNFVATTSPLTPDYGSGSAWQFTGMPPLASIVNYGTVKVGQNKSLYLIAQKVENHGNLEAPAGSIGLYAGKKVLVSERADGRGLSATVQLPFGSIDNSGNIVADAGAIALQAQVVNQNGLIQANSVKSVNGVIELLASEAIHLDAGSQILANGDSRGISHGGLVTLKAGKDFSDSVGSKIETQGGKESGNGGDVEVSAANIHSLESSMNAGAQPRWTGGKFLLDPVNIVLGASGAGSVPVSGTVPYDSGAGTLSLNVNTAFANKNFSAINLQASANITLAANTVWNLSQSTGISVGQLTLQAGGDIIFNNGSQILDANNWSVNLQAGVSFPAGAIQSGVGNIYLNGGNGKAVNGAISTGHGNVQLSAGNNILVGTGFIRTTGGGSIQASALSGDVNAGTANGGYQFSIFGYSVNPNLGGISTAAGGDVILEAGHNIVSTPTIPSNQPAGASGAYGKEAGNVTLKAGNQVLGNFTLANGVGTILAGVEVNAGQVTAIPHPQADIGSSQRPVSLSLINGSWNAWAARDLFISEVRNPNGTFNSSQLNVPSGKFVGNVGNTTVPPRSSFLFDYAPDAGASFWAGNSITLAGSNLPRVSGQNQSMPPIYAPILNLNAGAGGIHILNSLLLYPSSKGALHIVTRDGGNLTGAPSATSLTGITMSDSGLPGWATLGQGHALKPWHLNDATPITLDISGSIESFGLIVPTFADIHVLGSTYNFGFSGRNLSTARTTSIEVEGDITYRGNLTNVKLSDPLPQVLLDPSSSGNPGIASRLRFSALTATLTFIGLMSPADLAFLLNPTQVARDVNGQPILDIHGVPVLRPVSLSTVQQNAIHQLYTESQTASLGDQGLTLAGPGSFNISARNIDLGISGGISVGAPDFVLAAISPYGASLKIVAEGNLDMTSTKIANESLLGSIVLQTGGKLDVGGQLTTFGDPNAPRGIFSTSGGNVSVTAGKDVNVNGSRIAAYNGGNINVISQHGNVNAGSGASGFVSLQALELDPLTHRLIAIPATIPGSGILATTLVGSRAALGNITVATPEGSINASLGGIIQIAFNGTDTHNTFIDLNAGHDINAGGSGIIG
ncbi:MAG: Filamentous hemagglutinin family outer membrane protein, partial [Verrucomicrobiales bacterium]|nr:Filamentous hemagglutinin family outer membrane protein [Verrucomicrobiales bacterium]